MTPSKDHNNLPVTDPKTLKSIIYLKKNFKCPFKGISMSYKNMEKDNSTKLVKKYIHKQNKKFNKEIENHFKKFCGWRYNE